MIGNILKPLVKSVLIPLPLRAASSATDVAIQKEMFGSGLHLCMLASHSSDFTKQTTLTISNE